MSSGLGFIAAFALGSIPFGWIFARLWGVEDLRREGSQNVGATNVVRTAGWAPGALTFALDFLKGLLPVLFLQCAGLACPSSNIAFGVAAVLGHCYSPILSFRGGKGVSSFLGMMLAADWRIGAASLVAYVLGLAGLRVSALGSLFALLTALTGELLFGAFVQDKILVCFAVLLILHRHRTNWDAVLGKTAVFLALCGAVSIGSAPAYADEIALTDFQNQTVRLVEPARKIAALMPSLAESIVDFGEGDRLIGVPEYTRLPSPLKKKARVLGPYSNLSAELIYSLHPDLVVASMDGNDPKLVAKLKALGLKVLTVNTHSISEILRTLRLIGQAVGKGEDPKLANFARELEMRDSEPVENPVHVFIQIGWEPLVSVGAKTFIHEMIERAGGKNIFGDAPTSYPRPSPEEVISRNPEVIVICQLTDSGAEAEKAKRFWARFPKIKAVKNGRVHVVPGDWLTKPGFSLLRGMTELRRILTRTA